MKTQVLTIKQERWTFIISKYILYLYVIYVYIYILHIHVNLYPNLIYEDICSNEINDSSKNVNKTETL